MGELTQSTTDTVSQFPRPNFECRDCGRPCDHVFCFRWLERLRLFFGGKAAVTAGKAAAIIRILSTPGERDPRFLEFVVEKISRGRTLGVPAAVADPV